MKTKLFYGWVIVAACFLITMFPIVLINTYFSYYQIPVTTEFNASYFQFNITSIFATLASIVFSTFFAGKLATGDLRKYMFIGGMVSAALAFAFSLVTALWQMYVIACVLNFAFSAVTYIPINILMSNWFIDRKGFATAMVFLGGGLGGMLLSKPVATLIETGGWRFSFKVAALVTAVVVLIASALIRKTPQEMGLEPYREKGKEEEQKALWLGFTKKEAMKTKGFILYALSMVLLGVTIAGISTQLPTFFIEANMDYAKVMMVWFGFGIITKFIVGPLYDKTTLSIGTIVCCGLGVISMILLPLAEEGNYTMAYLSMICFSFAGGASMLLPPLLVGHLFGYREFGGLYGLGNAFFMAGCMIGPVFTSAIRTYSGSYQGAWLVCLVCYACIIGLVALAQVQGNRNRSLAQ